MAYRTYRAYPLMGNSYVLFQAVANKHYEESAHLPTAHLSADCAKGRQATVAE